MANKEAEKEPVARVSIGQSFGHTVDRLYSDLRNLLKGGFGGGILYFLLSKDEQGRSILAKLAELSGHVSKRVAIEGQPLVEDIKNWTVNQYRQFQTLAFQTVGYLFAAGAVALLSAALIPWYGPKGLVISSIVLFVFFLVHEFWARMIPVVLAIGVAAGEIEQGSTFELTLAEMKNLPAFLLGGIKHGLPKGLEWVTGLWKGAARITIWFIAGAMYLNLLPVFHIPWLIPSALPLVGLFVLIPLCEPWDKRGAQYSWLMWAGLMILVDYALLWIFPDELWQPILDGKFWARVIMVAVAIAQGYLAWRTASRSRNDSGKAPRPTSSNTAPLAYNGAPLYPMPNHQKRDLTWIGILLAGVILLIAYLCIYEQWGAQITPTLSNHMFPEQKIGDGACPGKFSAIVTALGPDEYQVRIPADTGWDRLGLNVWPGDKVRINVTQPMYQSGSETKTVAGVVCPYWLRHGHPAAFAHYGDTLFTPHDNARQIDQQKFFFRADLPRDGLIMKFGQKGLPKFCGRGGQITCPGIFQPGAGPTDLYFALNLGQTLEQRDLLSGSVIIKISIIRADPKHRSFSPPPHQ